jgi:hypothetical protein
MNAKSRSVNYIYMAVMHFLIFLSKPLSWIPEQNNSTDKEIPTLLKEKVTLDLTPICNKLKGKQSYQLRGCIKKFPN